MFFVGSSGEYGECGYLSKDWRIEALKCVPRTLSSATCLHVAVLVYLRLVGITQPLKYEQIHHRLRYISIVAIWLVSIVIDLIPVVALRFKQELIYDIFREVIFHGLHTIPVICIVLMYGKLSWVLSERMTRKASVYSTCSAASGQSTGQTKKSRSNRIIKGIVLCLLVFYIPYLSAWEYAYSVIAKRCVTEKIGIYVPEV